MAAELQAGDLVERYRVESVLGKGGTACVYRVRHTTLETVHALKVLTLDHPEIRDRLIAEGKAQAKLTHPNIVPVRDVIDHQGVPTLLMDFVPGRTLAQFLKADLPPQEETIRLFCELVKGVAYAHQNGLVHRDIKPGNVLLDETTAPICPRVTDFGLVRVLDLPEDAVRHTLVGATMGTLGFMAPEQLRDSRLVDARTDIFSLGALLYSMVTRCPPFVGVDQLDIMNATAACRYPPVLEAGGPTILPEIVRAIEGCLQVDPEDRYQSAEELLSVLGVFDSSSAVENIAADTKGDLFTQDTGVSVGAAVTRIEAPPVELPNQSSPGMSASLTGLVVDQTGRGHAVELSVVIDPEGNGVQHAPGVARDAQVAAQLAVAVALGASAEECGVKWSIRGFTEEVHGTSLGLPLAVGLWAAQRGLAIPKGFACTGGMDLDGRVAPVSGVPAKLRAAQDAGLRTVFVPADGLGGLEPPRGLSVNPVRTFDGVVARLFPKTQQKQRTWWRPRLLALLVPILMAITSLTAALEPLLHDPMLRATHGALPADNTAILAFPPQRDARDLRSQHADVIDQLVAAGARAIFFDVILIAKTEHDDAIAEAIERAKNKGVQVVLPIMTENDEILFPESDSLRDTAWFGAVLAQADSAFWHVRRAPMRVRSMDQGDHWHAAVQSVRAHFNVKEEPRIEDGQLIIGPVRNAVWSDLAYLHPTIPTPILSYLDSADWDQVNGRTVIIGEMGGADDVHRTDAGTVYGVQIEAALIETLIQQRAPRLLPPEVSALFALLVGLCTAVIGFALPRSRRWLALFVPLCGTVVVIAFVLSGSLLAVIPMLVAAGVGFWAIND
ncbi:MAG: protein kinase domain-containing protein [Myxococcota bacterium]